MINGFEAIRRAVLDAGEAIMAIYLTGFHVSLKEDDSPLTLADIKANEIILDALRKEYPRYAILSEESKDDKSRLANEYCFLVDPLDGTKEFVNRTGEFTVNVALAHRGHPVFGMVLVPAAGRLYWGQKGEGAYIEDLQTGRVTRIRVSDRTDDLIWVGSRSHASEKERQLIETHRNLVTRVMAAGSSLKGCLVAEGKAHVYYRFGLTSQWDTAAMHCIVEEAGGIFRQMDGTQMRYNREDTLNEKGFYAVNAPENIWV